MDAPAVGVLMVTDWVDVYVPPARLKLGLAVTEGAEGVTIAPVPVMGTPVAESKIAGGDERT